MADDKEKLKVTTEEFDFRLKASSHIAQLTQMAQMTEDEQLLSWLKNRSHELVGSTTRQLRSVQEKK